VGGGAMSQTRAPPAVSPIAWARRNLFASVGDTVVTILGATLIAWVVWSLFDWAVLKATFVGESRAACRAGGACWALVTARWRQVFFGFYPIAHVWRVAAAMACLLAAVIPIAVRQLPSWTRFLAPVGVIAAWAVLGGAHVLPSVPTEYWGGVFLNLLIGVTGAAFALPIGILLALGRRSQLPVIKALSVGFIEMVRAVPLISLLFMASVMLPLFVPSGVSLDRLTRAMVVITLFESAYMAEIIRGGLQAVPKGQSEAARALGLSPWRATAMVVLPQAIKISIPAIVNTFIGLFMDTTLVYVIALLEVTGVMHQALADFAWHGRDVEAYAFIALVFWIVCFSMSRVAASLERPTRTDLIRPAREPA
jgi:general L-amino acid transport system permease protein